MENLLPDVGFDYPVSKILLPNTTNFLEKKNIFQLNTSHNKIFLCLNVPVPLNLVNGLFRN